ncbi:MAG: DUF3365 domain-containing protein [Nitrospirales bacterium]|nr:DUF3365 domain-containing protein [Nitrospira sp.]MDR4500511.1 DUF3365 domain-containing protein [Nitrospirales bacterium]
MNGRSLIISFLIASLCFAVGWVVGGTIPPSDSIPARTVASYLQAVIDADRTFYTQHVVERMEAMLIVTSSEEWRKEKTLPLPVQFLREASRSLHVRGTPFRYRLVSLWPLNPQNAPSSPAERTVLEQVVEYGEVVEKEVMVDGKRYFKAVYPDRAVSRACVSCHNSHPDGPKRDFKLNDVMGGLVIQIPLE